MTGKTSAFRADPRRLSIPKCGVARPDERKGVANVRTAADAGIHKPYVIGNVNLERHPAMILEFEPSVARTRESSPETFATPFLSSGRATRPKILVVSARQFP
jgi:hypothetical protein